MTEFKFGWRPDVPDFRDHLFLGKTTLSALPPAVDLRPDDAPVYDQGSLGSCTGNATGAMFQFVNKKLKSKDFIPSRLFIYYGARKIEGTIKQDAGAYLRDTMKVIVNLGVCKETTWKYDIAKFKRKPPVRAYKAAMKHQALEYQRLPIYLNSMKQCLADGFPFVFGFAVFDSFVSNEVARTGVMPMPSRTESMLGGHAVTAVGYDDTRRCMIVRNSWGSGWGDGGYFYMPYEFISNNNLADDFWTLRKVEVVK